MPSRRPRLVLCALLVAACESGEGGRTSGATPTTLGEGEESESEGATGSEDDSTDGGGDSTDSTAGDEGLGTCTSDEDCPDGEYCLIDTCTMQWWEDCPAGAEVSVAVGYRDIDATEPEFEFVYDKCVDTLGTMHDGTINLVFDVRAELAPYTNSRLLISMPDGTWADNPLVIIDGEPASLTWSDEVESVFEDGILAFNQPTGELTRVEYEQVGDSTIVGVTFVGTFEAPSINVAVDMVMEGRFVLDNGFGLQRDDLGHRDLSPSG